LCNFFLIFGCFTNPVLKNQDGEETIVELPASEELDVSDPRTQAILQAHEILAAQESAQCEGDSTVTASASVSEEEPETEEPIMSVSKESGTFTEAVNESGDSIATRMNQPSEVSQSNTGVRM
jgi:hypothetical protein